MAPGAPSLQQPSEEGSGEPQRAGGGAAGGEAGRAGAMKGPAAGPSEVLRAGELEKRSASLLQLWKKKRAVLSADRLSLCAAPEGRAKELGFGAIRKVDCVERTGKYVYFTIVTTDRREIDFRCPGESGWNASITLALIAFQNRRAVQDFKSRPRDAPDTRDRRLARAP